MINKSKDMESILERLKMRQALCVFNNTHSLIRVFYSSKIVLVRWELLFVFWEFQAMNYTRLKFTFYKFKY